MRGPCNGYWLALSLTFTTAKPCLELFRFEIERKVENHFYFIIKSNSSWILRFFLLQVRHNIANQITFFFLNQKPWNWKLCIYKRVIAQWKKPFLNNDTEIRRLLHSDTSGRLAVKKFRRSLHSAHITLGAYYTTPPGAAYYFIYFRGKHGSNFDRYVKYKLFISRKLYF